MGQSVPLVRWSTDSETPDRRLDLYASLLSSSLSPMQMTAPRDEEFVAHLTSVELGLISVAQQKGSPHICRQNQRDQDRALEKSFHLVLNLAVPWDVKHRGTHHLEPGDAMLFDSTLPWEIYIARSYNFIHVKLADPWLRQWVPSPGALVGRPIGAGAGAGWGRALAAFAAQLSPEFLVDSPLPHSVVADHVGALLALSASQLTAGAPKPSSPGEQSLSARVAECIQQRCCEPGLTAEQVAHSVGVSVRTLHRCLAGQRESFGSLLVGARSDTAVRMLSTPMFKRLTIAEIARRSGFSDASHFTRVVRARTGRTPSEVRGAFGTTNRDENSK